MKNKIILALSLITSSSVVFASEQKKASTETVTANVSTEKKEETKIETKETKKEEHPKDEGCCKKIYSPIKK